MVYMHCTVCHHQGAAAQIREDLLRSIVLHPEDVAEREALWIAFFEAKWPR